MMDDSVNFVGSVRDRLISMYRPEEKLFFSSVKAVQDSVQFHSMPEKDHRYTINSFLGLTQVDCRLVEPAFDLKEEIKDFVEMHLNSIESPGDIGLLLLLHVEADVDPPEEMCEKVRSILKQNSTVEMNLQEASWILWGLARYSTYSNSFESLTEEFFHQFVDTFIDEERVFPLHSQTWFRREYTSFGAIVYFLRALYEYFDSFDQELAYDYFEETVRPLIHCQGPNGEWPWFYNNKTGDVVDPYPVYSVHQDSMAFLFLEKYLDELSNETVIHKSLSWLRGKNDLREEFYDKENTIIYRSLYRKGYDGSLGRLRRLIKGYLGKFSDYGSLGWGNGSFAINRECRSYHLGWILYVWGSSERLKGYLSSSLAGEVS